MADRVGSFIRVGLDNRVEMVGVWFFLSHFTTLYAYLIRAATLRSTLSFDYPDMHIWFEHEASWFFLSGNKPLPLAAGESFAFGPFTTPWRQIWTRHALNKHVVLMLFSVLVCHELQRFSLRLHASPLEDDFTFFSRFSFLYPYTMRRPARGFCQ